MYPWNLAQRLMSIYQMCKCSSVTERSRLLILWKKREGEVHSNLFQVSKAILNLNPIFATTLAFSLPFLSLGFNLIASADLMMVPGLESKTLLDLHLLLRL